MAFSTGGNGGGAIRRMAGNGNARCRGTGLRGARGAARNLWRKGLGKAQRIERCFSIRAYPPPPLGLMVGTAVARQARAGRDGYGGGNEEIKRGKAGYVERQEFTPPPGQSGFRLHPERKPPWFPCQPQGAEPCGVTASFTDDRAACTGRPRPPCPVRYMFWQAGPPRR
jgi:hypothetical protein